MSSLSKERPVIELETDVEYPFVWMTANLGVAEFIVCPVFKYGKLREFHMFSAQQLERKHYVYKFDYSPIDFSISSWTHKDMQAPRIWVNFWCKEHKCMSFRFYVPRNATKFTVNTGSNFSIDFDNEPIANQEGQS